MKVWELIEQLSLIPAGAHVFARPNKGDASYAVGHVERIDDTDPTAGIYLVLERERP